MNKPCFIILFFFVASAYSQDTLSDEESEPKPRKEKGFQAGFFAGTYLANKYTSTLYDGYGLDVNGNKNTFYNSALYTQIVVVNGGYNGQPDRIAEALGVQHGEWSFSESDMPVNLKYAIAFMAGGSLRYQINEQSSFLLNANTSKLTVNGEFTIVTQTISNGSLQPQQIRTCALAGSEQRVLLQFGYQHMLNEDAKVSPFMEYGLNVTMSKFIRNLANVNGLLLDLSYNYLYPRGSAERSQYLSGVGLGAYAVLGINFNLGSRWLMQFAYSPTYEQIKLGADPKRKVNHAFGVRGYYTF